MPPYLILEPDSFNQVAFVPERSNSSKDLATFHLAPFHNLFATLSYLIYVCNHADFFTDK